MNNIVRIKKFIVPEYLILSLILVIAFFLRLYKINNPLADWHSFRQADTAAVTRYYVENGIDLLNPRYHDVSARAYSSYTFVRGIMVDELGHLETRFKRWQNLPQPLQQ